MERRQKIGLALLIIALLAALAYWLYPRTATVAPAAGGQPEAAKPQAGLSVTGTKPLPLTTKPIPKPSVETTPATTAASTAGMRIDDLRPLAKTFSERYLTFSTAGDFENLQDVKLMATTAFAAKIEKQIQDGRAQPPAADFFGVTSRAISVNFLAVSEAEKTAVVEVDMNRQERGNGGQLRTPYNQRLTIVFVMQDDQWKVDDATLEAYKR
jgi:hypothetical protein